MPELAAGALAHRHTPLTFDPDTKQPVLLQMFSTWQFAKWVADDVHARGGVMHGNGGTLWPYFPALLDTTGQETGGILSARGHGDGADHAARQALLAAAEHPLLPAARRLLMTATSIASALYDIFPSYFNGDYFENGEWVTARFFDEPELYEQVRPLYKQFIPILRRMFAAGWQPVTLATVGDGCLVERYGPAADGQEVLFAVYNPGTQAVTATLTVPVQQLNMRAAGAAGLVSGADLTCTTQGDMLRITVPLAADRCEVVSLSR